MLLHNLILKNRSVAIRVSAIAPLFVAFLWSPVFAQTIDKSTARLTSSQSGQILEIQRQANQKFLEDFAKLQRLQEEINELLLSQNASDETIRQKYQELRVMLQKLSDTDFETRLAIRNVLPPNLRRPFAQILQDYAKRSQKDI